MKNVLLSFLFILPTAALAQVSSNAIYQIPFKKANNQIRFSWGDQGTPTPIEWGLDLAWLSEDNVARSIAFCGKEVVDFMRLSFQPTHSVAEGTFSAEQLSDLKKRISITKKYCKTGVGYNINCDHASLDEWYNDECSTSAERAQHWAQLIDMTADYYKNNGLTNLVSISPLNEPDYEWHALPTFKHRKEDFREICKLLKTSDAYKEKYANVRLCGGNTLNDDQAYTWWNYLKSYLDEGNTHQLAGSFDNYASFYETLTKAGHHATNDELHNTMEAMVGVQYGMQTGIWWGSADHARGQFMKATYQGNPGARLGYVENRDNWTSASIYRQAGGTVQGFVGSSERQAVTTTFEFISQDRDVYYNGQGPMRHFVMEIPGGTGYQNGQTNAETVFDIQSGEDVQNYINGRYRIVNKYNNRTSKTAKYLGFKADPGSNWRQLEQNTLPTAEANKAFMEWIVTPIDSRIGGDYSYYDIKNAGNENLRMDILNWSLSNGGQVGSFPGDLGNNEIWYLQYAGDGWFYIRSKHSNLALACSTTSAASANTIQATFKEGEEKQMWRFLEPTASYDRVAPQTPTNLKAKAQPASIRLEWDAVEDEDLKGYEVLRANAGAEDWNIIARELKGTAFVDNTAEDGKSYVYVVQATDNALNHSEKSNTVESSSTMEKALICHLTFDNNLYDSSVNGNHAIMADDPKYSTNAIYVKEGNASLGMSNDDSFVQLPSTIAQHESMTISFWTRRTSSSSWERLFDFGNGTEQYMFLTPSNGSKMVLELKNNGVTENLEVPILSSLGMKHVAVTIDGEKGVAKIYVNGELKGTKENLTIKPSDIKAVSNYIGRSQFDADPILKGYIDDFRIYNFALSKEEVVNSMNADTDAIKLLQDEENNSDKTLFDLNGRPATPHQKGIKIGKNKKQL